MGNANESAIWFVFVGDAEAGPFTRSVIQEYINTGELAFNDMCWRDGFSEWIPLGRTVEFASRQPYSKQPSEIQKLKVELSEADFGHRDSDVNIPPSTTNPVTHHKSLRKNYFSRHWRGELSLPKSYWLNSYGLTAILVLIGITIGMADFTSYPMFTALLYIGFWMLLAASQVWLTVGIVRSARKYSANYPLKSGWGTAAVIFSALGFLSTLSVLIKDGIPQIIGFAEIFSTAAQQKTYSTQLLRNSTEIELSGRQSSHF